MSRTAEGIEDDVLGVRRYAADGAGPRNGIRLLCVVVGERADIGFGCDIAIKLVHTLAELIIE